VLRIFGPMRHEVTGERRKLHIEELNDLYFSRNCVQVIKSRRLRSIAIFSIHTLPIGRVCSSYGGGEEILIQGYGGVTLGQETTWKTRA
jgi:hypothetical protein